MINPGDGHLEAENVKGQADIPPPEIDAASAAGTAVAASDPPGHWRKVGGYRWVICGLLFFATTINYVDRQVLSILAKDLQTQIGWSESEYGYITAAFQGAYALGMLLVGRLMDWLGTRKGFAVAIIFWSAAGIATAFARTAFGFGIARFLLGLGEAGNFPASIKTVAEWFPKKERALATGIFNSGSNVGAIVAPLTVPFIAAYFGWQWAFIGTGALGFIWLIFWLALYHKPEEHPKIKSTELAYINSDPADPPAHVPWLSLFPFRQTWAFAIGKAMTDPVWWFYLFWLPKLFQEKFNLKITGLALPLVIIYVAADFGSIGGGWLSSTLLKRGWSANAARKTAMLVCGACMLPVLFVPYTDNMWLVIAIFSLACSAHQGWSANVFTLVSDMFPRRTVGSVVGIGGMAGALAGMFVSIFVGQHLEKTQSYTVPIVIAAFAYLTCLFIIHLLVPRLEPAKMREA